MGETDHMNKEIDKIMDRSGSNTSGVHEMMHDQPNREERQKRGVKSHRTIMLPRAEVGCVEGKSQGYGAGDLICMEPLLPKIRGKIEKKKKGGKTFNWKHTFFSAGMVVYMKSHPKHLYLGIPCWKVSPCPWTHTRECHHWTCLFGVGLCKPS